MVRLHIENLHRTVSNYAACMAGKYLGLRDNALLEARIAKGCQKYHLMTHHLRAARNAHHRYLHFVRKLGAT